MSHLQSDPLVPAFDVEAFVRFGTVEYCLERTESALESSERIRLVKHSGWGVWEGERRVGVVGKSRGASDSGHEAGQMSKQRTGQRCVPLN